MLSVREREGFGEEEEEDREKGKTLEGDIDGVRGWSGEVSGTVDSKRSFRSRRAGGHSPAIQLGHPEKTLGSFGHPTWGWRRSWSTWETSVSTRAPPSAAHAALVTCAAVTLTPKASGTPKSEPPASPELPGVRARSTRLTELGVPTLGPEQKFIEGGSGGENVLTMHGVPV